MTTLQRQFLMTIFARWVHRSQQDVVEGLQAENRVLRETSRGMRALCVQFPKLKFPTARCLLSEVELKYPAVTAKLV